MCEELFGAIERNDVGAAEALADDCRLLYESDEGGDRPLHLAARLGRLRLAHLFIALGARLDAKNYEGKTPLHLAAARNNAAMAELLVQSGAALDARDYRRETPLQAAVRAGAPGAARLLIEWGTRTKGGRSRIAPPRFSHTGLLRVEACR